MFEAKKLQWGKSIDILGVLEIKKARKEQLIDEIASILKAGILEPGHASKFKGKLMLGASQFWGKVGRAFLLAIPERQYARSGRFVELDRPIRLSLEKWKYLVDKGSPREILMIKRSRPDVVIFTDGFTPDQRRNQTGPNKIGMTVVINTAAVAAQAMAVVPADVVEKWIPWSSQICMVELLTPVLAFETFKHYLKDKLVLLLVDAEAMEGALIKGFSSRSDVCELVGMFRDLVLESKSLVYIDRVPTDANCSDPPPETSYTLAKRWGGRPFRSDGQRPYGS